MFRHMNGITSGWGIWPERIAGRRTPSVPSAVARAAGVHTGLVHGARRAAGWPRHPAAGAVLLGAVAARQQQIQQSASCTSRCRVPPPRIAPSRSLMMVATTAFISTCSHPAPTVALITRLSTDASNALVTADTMVSIWIIRMRRPVVRDRPAYGPDAGLVVTARANDDAGNPIGVAYLGDASALMQDTVLPIAGMPCPPTSQRPSSTRKHGPSSRPRRHRQSPWAALALLLLAAALYLARKTHLLP